MGENDSKWNNRQIINFQNIQAADINSIPEKRKKEKKNKQKKQPNQKVCKRPKQTFISKKDIHNKYMKRWSMSLIIRKM